MYIYTHTHTFILMYIHVYPLCTVSDTDFTFIGVIQFPFLYTKQMSWLKENIKLKTNCTWIQPKSWQRIENNQVSPTQCCFKNSQVLVRCADAQPPRPEWKARRKTHKSLGNFLHAEVWEPLRHSTWTIFTPLFHSTLCTSVAVCAFYIWSTRCCLLQIVKQWQEANQFTWPCVGSKIVPNASAARYVTPIVYTSHQVQKASSLNPQAQHWPVVPTSKHSPEGDKSMSSSCCFENMSSPSEWI